MFIKDKEDTLTQVVNRSSGHPKGRSGTEHLHFSTEFALRLMGDVQVFY
jgi:hypothetical protein